MLQIAKKMKGGVLKSLTPENKRKNEEKKSDDNDKDKDTTKDNDDDEDKVTSQKDAASHTTQDSDNSEAALTPGHGVATDIGIRISISSQYMFCHHILVLFAL